MAQPSDLDEHGRPEPPAIADEAATLLGFLDFLRGTIAWKCSGLSGEQLRATLGPSSMTLGGVLKHLAYVEDAWLSDVLHGNEAAEPWASVDWERDPDWDWNSAADDAPEQLWALWTDAVDRSRERTSEALATAGPEQPAGRPLSDGRAPSLRWILCHMVEEYARHCGHVDLLRESIDGLTGE
jgi:uncharacterized damage-inducible protein DinB